MRIVITGGGTGGHLFPGIALASGLQQRISGCRIMFIGTPRQLDRRTLADYDFELQAITCMGLKGMGLKNRIRSLLQLPLAVMEARRILRRFQPRLVFGVGGYVTGPVLLAARMLKIPTAIHEQNTVPGLANRMLARVVDRIFLSLPCRYDFPARKTELTGNPVRAEILAAAQSRPAAASGDDLHLLILGGSQGAHGINMMVSEAAGRIVDQAGCRVSFTHQTGVADLAEVRSRYRRIGAAAEVNDFFSDMAGLYRSADLVISRAGATTLAELAVMGLPALLIPYPHAADNHQQLNGEFYVHGGAAVMYREDDLDAGGLAREIVRLARGRKQLREMSSRMKALARPEAADRLIEVCLEMAA